MATPATALKFRIVIDTIEGQERINHYNGPAAVQLLTKRFFEDMDNGIKSGLYTIQQETEGEWLTKRQYRMENGAQVKRVDGEGFHPVQIHGSGVIAD